MQEIIRPLLFKDARRLWILLCVWASVLAFKTFLYVGGAYIFSSNFEYQITVPLFYRAVDFFEKVLVIFIIPMCLHEDACVGTTAFWFSRPLSRRAVLATKGLFLSILFVCIPLVLEMAMLALSGVSTPYVLLSCPEIILERLAFILPFILLASITGRFSEYAKVGAIILGVGIVWSISLSIIVMAFPKAGMFLFKVGQDWQKIVKSAVDSRGVVISLLKIIFLTALIIHQHLTRYTARTVRWTIFFGLLIMMIARVWTWDFMKPVAPTDKELKATLNSEIISVNFDAAHIFIADGQAKDGATKIVRSRFIVSGMPPQYYAAPDTNSKIQMWYDDGTTLESPAVMFRPMFASVMDDALMPVFQSALGAAVIKNAWTDKFIFNDIFELSTDDFEKFKNKPGTYAVDMLINFYDYQMSSVLPIDPGVVENKGKQQIKIFALTQKKDELSVLIMERNANMLFDRSVKKDSNLNIFTGKGLQKIYLLRNPKTQEALLPEMGGQADAKRAIVRDADYLSEGLRLQIKVKKINFDFSGTGITLTSGWLQDAELIRLEPRLRTTIKKKVRIKDFAIPAVSTDPNPALHNPVFPYRIAQEEEFMGRSWKDKTEEEIGQYPVPPQLKNKKTVSDYKYQYIAKKDHKAFAYSATGAYGYCYRMGTQDEAKECALGFCNKYRNPGQVKCSILSVDGEVVQERASYE